MTTVITRGASSAQALGYAARATAANYIEDVFSTYLYTGNGSTQTITNGIDLSTKGGLVWFKARGPTTNYAHCLYDTARGFDKALQTNTTAAQLAADATPPTTSTTGFVVGTRQQINNTNELMASWTFRKQAKFFDVVTYTGDGVAGRTVSHSLGAVPGCIIVKRLDGATADWQVYHRSLGATKYILLNSTAAESTVGASSRWNSTAPTSTNFTLGDGVMVNNNGTTYVAYLFAHDAGGFGASGSDNVISCGSFTGTGSDVTVTLGYEPQWLLVKRATGGTDNWAIFDNMRGMFVNFDDNILFPNLSNAELVGSGRIAPTATGFIGFGGVYAASSTYIYIAIRRGPMRTPTSGTSVFSPNISSGGSTTEVTTGFPNDLTIYNLRGGTGANSPFVDRLRGLAPNSSSTSQTLISSSTAAEAGYNVGYEFWNTSFKIGSYYGGNSNVFYSFRRAPGFFDVVCYSASGSSYSSISVNHNLGVAPELYIVKPRTDNNSYSYWIVGSPLLGNTYNLVLQTNGAKVNNNFFTSTAPTSSVISVQNEMNTSGNTYVAYLFASCPGVSKVGSYTGTGTTKQIDCGFTGGARFVLIKRTDSTGDWYVWDSARGIVAGNDPYLLLNSTAAEVTNTDYVDTYSAGFEISSTAPAAINANGGTFIFFAIA